MKCSLSLANRKQTVSFGIVGLIIAIAPLWLMLPAATTSAQTSDDASNSSATANAATVSPGDWTQFHRDNMQRWNPYETLLGVGNVKSLQNRWQTLIQQSSIFSAPSTPAVANGVIYLGSSALYALNANTGIVLWTYYTGGDVESSPAVANGVVYVGSDDGNLYALNASSGARLWSFNTGNKVRSSPAVADGVVYVGSDDHNVYALNATTGAKLWSYATVDLVYSSPAVVNGMVYVGSCDHNVYALNASTGAKLWSYAAGDCVLSSPAVANGVIYVGVGSQNPGPSGQMLALNASTGAKLWSFDAGGPVVSSPAVANGVVYFGSDDFHTGNGKIYAVNAKTGTQLWRYTADAPYMDSSPAVANGVVYFGSQCSALCALNANTGALLSQANFSVQTTSSPTVTNGVVYVHWADLFGNGFEFVNSFSLLGADLFLRINPSTTTPHQGDLLTYAFAVWNLGPDIAEHEVLNTQVPPGATFDSIRISGTPGLGTCTHPPYGGTGQIVCHEGAGMAQNTTWTVRLTVKVTAPSRTVITENAATVSDAPDPNLANNTATVRLTVQ
jgi:outer membrane protein assembly factor BamB